MARASRLKTREDFANMSLPALNNEIRYLTGRERNAGTSVVAKVFRKQREVAERVRDAQYGVVARGKNR